MITCEIRGQLFGLSFQYFLGADDHGNRKPVSTQATLALLDEDKRIVAKWTGSAWCHEKDQFRKSVGRRIALTRAILNASRHLSFRKEDRQALWKAYLSRKEPRVPVVPAAAGDVGLVEEPASA